MTQLSLFGTLLASVRYDREDMYEVTIVEYELDLSNASVRYTERSWVRDTRDKPVNEWLKDLDLRLAP